MSRTLEQTGIPEAFAALTEELDRAQAAFREAEAYYYHGASVNLDAHSPLGLELLTCFLQRMDALARTLRGGALGAVERVWNATDHELQAVHRRQVTRTSADDRDERDRVDAERARAADASRAADRDEQRQVNRLLREASEEAPAQPLPAGAADYRGVGEDPPEDS